MSSALCPALFQRFQDNNGAPLAGGLVYTYGAGTTTPLQTFTDFGGLTPNTNPIVLDANGYANIWIGISPYKFVLADSANNTIRTVDNVQSLAAQITAEVAAQGGLSVNNNLSDLSNKPAALLNLGIAPFSYQHVFSITNGQGATNLAAETFDGSVYTSRVYNYEIIQGSTIQATGDFSVHYLNGTWVYYEGMGRGTAHGVTFTISQATTVGQLMAAESGSGNGTIKLKRHDFFA